MSRIEFVLGGARSGKSRQAEQRASELESIGKQVVYIATARFENPEDDTDHEMQARIEQHRNDRPNHWLTVECPVHLAEALQTYNHPQYCILVDCLTLWTFNLLEASCLQKEREAFLSTLSNWSGDLILVSNEVGLGVVPMGELTRQFVDELGWLHQRVAERADWVTFMAAGLPMTLKGPDV